MSDDRIAQLEKKLEALTRHVTDLEAIQEIRKTQHKYGYYIDKCLYLSILGIYFRNSLHIPCASLKFLLLKISLHIVSLTISYLPRSQVPFMPLLPSITSE